MQPSLEFGTILHRSYLAAVVTNSGLNGKWTTLKYPFEFSDHSNCFILQITLTHSYTDSGWCHAGCQPACQRIKCLAKGHINCGLKETGFELLIFRWVNDLWSHSRSLLIDPTISSWPRSAVMMFYLVRLGGNKDYSLLRSLDAQWSSWDPLLKVSEFFSF